MLSRRWTNKLWTPLLQLPLASNGSTGRAKKNRSSWVAPAILERCISVSRGETPLSNLLCPPREVSYFVSSMFTEHRWVREARSCYTSETAPGRATRGVAEDEKLSMTQSTSSDSAFASSAANLASMKLMNVSLSIRFDSSSW